MTTEKWQVKKGPWPSHGIASTNDDAVATASRKIARGERLNFDDGVALLRTRDVHGLAALANRVREERHEDRTFFNRNLHLNPSNICVETCRFCAYARRRMDSKDAWRMTREEAFEKIERDGAPPKTEVHVVGGLDPELPFDFYLQLLEGIRERAPHLHIKGFTAVEIDFFTQLTGLDHGIVLDRLIEAGLGSLPGGGVEMFSERVRKLLSVRKGSARSWLKVHHAAHERGLFSNATMLFGHIETLEERVDHLLHLRAAADRDIQEGLEGRFRTFIPLAFHPGNSGLRMVPGPTGLDALRTYAVSRLLLDNIEHIKAYWVQIGTEIAQTSLWWGVNDVDGTITEERIYHMAGSEVPGALTRDALVTLIRRAGRTPVERGTLYEIIEDDCRVEEAHP